METRRQAHAVYRCQYHIVWIPRYRYAVLTKGIAEYLEKKLKEVRKKYPEIEFIKINIQKDHVHLILSFPPKYSIARVIQIMKQNTSKALKEKFQFLREKYWSRRGIWSVGYFVSTIGLDEQMIARYVEHQAREDSGQAKLAL